VTEPCFELETDDVTGQAHATIRLHEGVTREDFDKACADAWTFLTQERPSFGKYYDTNLRSNTYFWRQPGGGYVEVNAYDLKRLADNDAFALECLAKKAAGLLPEGVLKTVPGPDLASFIAATRQTYGMAPSAFGLPTPHFDAALARIQAP
jgi:hypothetical protein